MRRRKYWTKRMLAVVACAGVLMTAPMTAGAVTAAERSAYQAVFDAGYYYSAYPDVAAAFGNNQAALFNHFVNYGLKEGRSCSADFNPQAYRANYADLQQAMTWQHIAVIMCLMVKQREETEAEQEVCLPVQLQRIRP